MDLKAIIAEKRAYYQANVDTLTRKEVSDHNNEMRDLMKQLNDSYIDGAVIPEKVAKYMVGGLHGLERVHHTDKAETSPEGTPDDKKTYAFTDVMEFEVGCTIKVCVMDEWKTQGLYAKGATQAEAVANWNAGNYQTR